MFLGRYLIKSYIYTGFEFPVKLFIRVRIYSVEFAERPLGVDAEQDRYCQRSVGVLTITLWGWHCRNKYGRTRALFSGRFSPDEKMSIPASHGRENATMLRHKFRGSFYVSPAVLFAPPQILQTKLPFSPLSFWDYT